VVVVTAPKKFAAGNRSVGDLGIRDLAQAKGLFDLQILEKAGFYYPTPVSGASESAGRPDAVPAPS
jgi:hypothetical protein